MFTDVHRNETDQPEPMTPEMEQVAAAAAKAATNIKLAQNAG